MKNTSTCDRPQLHSFYRADGEAVRRAIAAKLSGSDWAVWSYLQLRDPFGGRYIKISVAEIVKATEYSERAVRRSLERLREECLWDWRTTDFEGRNPWGKTAIEKRKSKVAELPLPNSPQADLQQADLPSVNTPQADLPLTNTPTAESILIDLSSVDTPQADPPVVDLLSVDTPQADLPVTGGSGKKTADLSSIRQICRFSDKSAGFDAQNQDTARVSNLLDLLDLLDPSDRTEPDEKINLPREEELVSEKVIAQVFGVGLDTFKRVGIHAYERAGIEVIDRTTARICYANHPPFVQLLAWAVQQSADCGGDRFRQMVVRWLAYVRESQRPIRNPYGNLRSFVRNELEDRS